MWDLRFQSRYPTWMAVVIGAVIGAIGYVVIVGGLGELAGWRGPVVVLLLPAVVGIVAELVIRAGWGVAGLALGTILAAQVLPIFMTILPPADLAELVLYLASGTIGYTVGAGILLAPSMPDFTPPPSADIVKAERDVRAQLRSDRPGRSRGIRARDGAPSPGEPGGRRAHVVARTEPPRA